MGRGRQKAKQTKVARQLKYFSPDTDYSALQRELANGNHSYADSQGDAALDDESDELDDDEDLDDDDEDLDDEDDADGYAHWAAEHGR